jgi:hypothetical protein
VLLVRIIKLLQTGSASGSVRVLKTAMEAVVPHAVAEAIAGLLVQDDRNLRSQLIRMSLVGILSVRSPKLVLGEDGRELGPFRRRTIVVRGNTGAFF